VALIYLLIPPSAAYHIPPMCQALFLAVGTQQGATTEKGQSLKREHTSRSEERYTINNLIK
jgi:hypothetical protein